MERGATHLPEIRERNAKENESQRRKSAERVTRHVQENDDEQRRGRGSRERGDDEATEDNEMGEQGNPFVLPDDENVFQLREKEREDRERKRRDVQSMRVEDKGTFSSSMQRAVPPGQVLSKTDKSHEQDKKELAGLSALPTGPRKTQKEDMAQFIRKKREIFLVQMSLNTKRDEMQNLDEHARRREEAIRKSEQMLEQDSEHFDNFLKENDAKVNEAIRKADQQVKAKSEKQQELKRLSASIQAVKSELNKYEEQLQDCRAYKRFLDELTPPDWFKEQRRSLGIAEDGSQDEDVDDLPMYFSKPQQLFDTFSELEERNLFLIQNSQETEEALEELKSKLRDHKAKMDPQAEDLKRQKQELERAIAFEQARASSLHASVHQEETKEDPEKQAQEQGSSVREKDMTKERSEESSLESICEKVRDVYVRCGFEHDRSTDTLQMLTNIEHKMEEYLDYVAKLPQDKVMRAEKERERQRRRHHRERKQEEQRREQESRIQKALDRASRPVPKKEGKPLMFRSRPVERRKEVDQGPAVNGEDEELQRFLARDL